MFEWGREREISERTAAWTFAIGGLAFMVVVAAIAIAHYAYGLQIKAESGDPLSPRDLLIFFSIAFVVSPIVIAKGVWMLTHPADKSSNGGNPAKRDSSP